MGCNYGGGLSSHHAVRCKRAVVALPPSALLSKFEFGGARDPSKSVCLMVQESCTRQVLGEFAECDPLVSEQMQFLVHAGNQAVPQENSSLQPLSRTSALIYPNV